MTERPGPEPAGSERLESQPLIPPAMGPAPQRVSPITVPDEDPALPVPDASQATLVRDAFRDLVVLQKPAFVFFLKKQIPNVPTVCLCMLF